MLKNEMRIIDKRCTKASQQLMQLKDAIERDLQRLQQDELSLAFVIEGLNMIVEDMRTHNLQLESVLLQQAKITLELDKVNNNYYY